MAFKSKKNRKVWILSGILIIVILGLVFVSFLKFKLLQPFSNKTGEKPYVDPEIYQGFVDIDGEEWVKVLIWPKSQDDVENIINSLSPSESKVARIGKDFSVIVTREGLEKLANDTRIKSIHLVNIGELELQESAALINATLVWNLGYTGEGQTVCVIDSGVNYSHPDLGGCTEGEFLGGSCSKVIGGYDYCNNSFGPFCLTEDNNPMDYYGHGTHVAGIVAANGNIQGIAPDVKIIALKVTDKYGIPDEDAVKSAVEWCHSNASKFNISIITMSVNLGGFYNNSGCKSDENLSLEIKSAYDDGLFIDCASGNNRNLSGIRYPACTTGTTSVGASYDDNLGSMTFCVKENSTDCLETCTDSSISSDEISCFTNRGNNLDLLAPGCAINSTNLTDGKYISYCGTSFAAPHVAGAAALLLQLKPDLTPEQIKDVLKLTGKPINDSSYSNLTFSRIDVLKAIMAVSASLLQVNNLTEVYQQETLRVLRFMIKNTNLSNITNIFWQANISDGSVINGTENITSLLFGKSAVVLFSHDFSGPGNYTVNVSARAGNLFYSQTLTINISWSNLTITQLSDIYTKNLQKVFIFKIKNFGSLTLNNINWSFDLGDGSNRISNATLTLAPNEEAFVYVTHNYSIVGNYTVNAYVSNGEYSDSENKSVSVPSTSDIDVYGLAVVNSSQTSRVFKFIIHNILSSNLSNVNWTLDFDDGDSRTSTGVIALITSEEIFVFAEHTYTSSDTYQVNATARNGTLIGSQTISVVI